MVYFDHAATSLPKPKEVSEAVLAAFNSLGNAGRGVNEASFEAARTIYGVRRQLAELFGGDDPSRFAFTCNSTESLNIAIQGLLFPGDHVITTVLEHNSVLRPLHLKSLEGVLVTYLSCDENGMVYPEQFASAVTERTKAIICTHGSNVTGNVLDIARIGQIAAEQSLLFIVDASQTAGFLPIDVKDEHIDVLCFTGHKGLLGPQGTGGIYVRPGLHIPSLKSGGSGVQTYNEFHPQEMPTALEAGTLNGHGIAGLGAALDYLKRTGLDEIRQLELARMRQFYDGAIRIPGIEIYGDFSLPVRCPIVSLNIEGADSAEVGDILFREYDICVRTGAHCAPMMHRALGTEKTGAVRFSFSHYNTEDEVEQAVSALKEIAEDAVS